MAIAKATCTCATCGREFEVTKICYNRRDADSWETWAEANSTECSVCRESRIQRERDEANATAKAAAEEAGLPELIGSEKQVAWANTIRQKALDKLREEWTEPPQNQEEVEDKARFDRFVAWLITAKTAAHWWIDNRDTFNHGLYSQNAVAIINEFMESEAEAEEAPLREAAQQETTAEPEPLTHEGRVEIQVTESAVTAKYPKNDDFRGVVKPLGYTWDKVSGAWQKKITVTTGTAQERAAELGNKLLNAGFAVCIADPETRQAAIEGRYEPEHQRWIVARDGKFVIKLHYGDGMYDKAKDIPKARYSKPDIVVPASEWAAVEDFAGLYDYRLPPGAQELLNQKKGVTIVVTPAPARAAVYAERDPAEIMKSSTDIIDDLREE